MHSVPGETSTAQLIGLTGAIASGKSTALFLFGEMGAAILSTDALVAEMLATDRGLQSQLVARWGDDVIDDKGHTDRSAVAKIVFTDPKELEWLEHATHPLVRQRVQEWHSELSPDTLAAVVEVPLLFEGDMHELFDTTVCITSSDADRQERIERRKLMQVTDREARQLSQDEKAAKADFVVANTGDLGEFTHALAEIWPQVLASGGHDGNGGGA